MTYLIAFYYRLKCVFGVHLWVGTLAGDDINSPVDYYWCLHCQKEQKHSPYKDGKE